MSESSSQSASKCPVDHSAFSSATLPPGSEGLPLVGETLDFLGGPPNFIPKRTQKYGSIFRTHLLGKRTIFMSGAKANFWVFQGENKYLVNEWPKTIRTLLGPESMVVLTGKEHRSRRKLLAPFFQRKVVDQYRPQIEAVIESHLAKWDTQESFDIVPAIRSLAFDIILVMIFGETQVDRAFLSHHLEIWLDGFFALLPWKLPFTKFGKAYRSRLEIQSYLAPILAARQELDHQPKDILGSLILAGKDTGEPLSDQAILDEILLQVFAGHDTTVTATSNLLLQLSQHPQHLETLRATLSDESGQIDLGNISEPILDHVIWEGMRYVPTIPGGFRKVTEDVEFQGHKIPKDYQVMVSIWAAHQQGPWTDPKAFDPARFHPDRAEDQAEPCTYIPFGGGPRTCIGQHFAMLEMKLMLMHILRNFEFELVPGQDLTYQYLPFPLPKRGIQMLFKRMASSSGTLHSESETTLNPS
ncbi:cytochrome P450 [Pontibacter sp. G13]|uniref:cytochrome P450 n=1 Tax=Pontibacter sp. G13 TaxID=3074898 RepID=UPI00288A3DE4|nr:cytochrome P450 [Pontibacter sp. G13]WNJ18341.1 cytochrome P450 [Pontibacter sp. G13]